jgi:hypothetical protein
VRTGEPKPDELKAIDSYIRQIEGGKPWKPKFERSPT